MPSAPVCVLSRPGSDPCAALWAAKLPTRHPLAIVAVPGVGFALAWSAGLAPGPAGLGVVAGPGEAGRHLAEIERRLGPRWVWWSSRPATQVVIEARVRLAACWDLSAVHRLLHGGRRGDEPAVWAAAVGLPPPPPRGSTRPMRAAAGQLDLWDVATMASGDDTGADAVLRAPVSAGAGHADAGVGVGGEIGIDGDALRGDGQLDADWLARAPSAAQALRRAARLAQLALTVHEHQTVALRRLADGRPQPGRIPLSVLTAWSESAAELLARELERDGLPLARPVAEALLDELIGPRPHTPADEHTARRRRDAPVLAHLPAPVDLRNPAAVRAGLRTIGIDVPDTRSGRLEPLRGAHPVVGALLAWRRAERIATTYGHRWLDEHVGVDGRLRGAWHGSDGGAGRMTAQAGLHNLPADLRIAVVAEPGRVFVRADLGQIEPRVLAIVSGDTALARATHADDMYAPVAAHLGRPRADAKIAMLAAMYGQTTGSAGEALRRMRRAYPTALAFLDAADSAGREGRDLRTFGGRLIPLAPAAAAGAGPGAARGLTDPPAPDAQDDAAPTPQALIARGRFARNAVVQGAAAELFKAWAATVRIELAALDGDIVLCLHDELLVHVPRRHAEQAAGLLHRTLAATAAYWAAGSGVRLVADVSILHRWSDAPH